MCNSKRAFLSQYFGYQLENSGTVDAYAATAEQNTRPIYLPTNPYDFKPELGFNGYRYAVDVKRVVSPYMQPGYFGIFPVKEQPKLSAPWPYDVPVLS